MEKLSSDTGYFKKPVEINRGFVFFKFSFLLIRGFSQSHYREVPRWGVSNGARHNWKCFLAYKNLKCFFKASCIFDASICATNYIISFEVYDGFIWSKHFEAMKAGTLAIQPWLSCQYTENTLIDEPCFLYIFDVNNWVLKLKLQVR